jgi:gamma-glutamyltranspeptidase/glutathione hydrolase
MTATQGFLFGSQVVIEGLGVVMNHGMSRFDFSPAGSPNAPAPLKRPFHNMSPTIVLDSAGRPRHAVGLPGGTKIVTVTAQLLADMIDFGLSPEEAVRAPRVHIETADPIAASSGVPDATLRGLEAMGHTTVRGQAVGGPPTEIAGMANAMSIDLATRRPVAASQGEAGSAVNF